MPLILEITYEDGSKATERVPAEVWRYSPKKITKLIVADKPIAAIEQDPYWETADVNVSNNRWPREVSKSRLKVFKEKRDKDNMMKDFDTPLKKAGEDKDASKKDEKAGDAK